MSRSFLAVVVVGAVAGLALMPAFLQGCSQTGVGDPCVPAREYDPTFNGFDPGEVNVESKSFQCQTRLCLANHFRGRVSCPYGQTQDGGAPPPLKSGQPYTDKNGDPIGPCSAPPGTETSGVPTIPVTGEPGSMLGATVDPQCLDRTASNAVYCSCRCANVNGRTDDGAVYCKCPDGFTCPKEALVTAVSTSDNGLTGSYCIKTGTDYDPVKSCQDTGKACNPSLQNCGTWNGQ